jgi:hypothetical protein
LSRAARPSVRGQEGRQALLQEGLSPLLGYARQ